MIITRSGTRSCQHDEINRTKKGIGNINKENNHDDNCAPEINIEEK